MVYCVGVGNWFKCLHCELLCSSNCPIEKGDIDEMLKQINLAEAMRSNTGPEGYGPISGMGHI